MRDMLVPRGLDFQDNMVALTGQSSAASFPTGPVMAEPFISPLGLTIYTR